MNKLQIKMQEDKFNNPQTFVIHPQVETRISTYDLSSKINAKELAEKIIILKNSYLSHTSNVKAWHTNFYIHNETNIFNDLIKIIENKVPYCFDTSNIVEASVTQCWATIYEKGDKAVRHKHFDTCYAAVYYCLADTVTSPLVFDNHLTIIPKTNMLVLFPGYVYHTVPEVKYENKRITVAFNINCCLRPTEIYEKN